MNEKRKGSIRVDLLIQLILPSENTTYGVNGSRCRRKNSSEFPPVCYILKKSQSCLCIVGYKLKQDGSDRMGNRGRQLRVLTFDGNAETSQGGAQRGQKHERPSSRADTQLDKTESAYSKLSAR
ncbi:hypothetical protein E2986_12129 [Frieseomelitta varia]|uniref:Uncharacterized protein n=1 Tax=Frieseomelitta varia TaxID=561572 RepID=A0A833S6D5_9HYME|nr:hypothetical protein E2986_12129 [Frieseomelitta varia]